MLEHRATYSPEDNKLRLYPACQLGPDDYARVKAAGFSWAPKQELFVAPAWSPNREDLLLEMCGDIEDEDTSLVDRAEQRAERFEDYSEKRGEEADRAREQVRELAGSIPMGQPILVGHHSEKRARRDAEKIQDGMSRAVKLWRTSEYWTRRAAGAIHAAKYKELPGVRARRIKGLEADRRKMEKDRAEHEQWLGRWTAEGLTLNQARALANFCRLYCVTPTKAGEPHWSAWDVLRPESERTPNSPCPVWTVEQVQEHARKVYPPAIARCTRWLEHLDNRIAYERAMLAEGGGLAGEKFDYQPGGQVQRRGSWYVVVKANKRHGAVFSVSVLGHFAGTIPIEEVQDYRPPQDGDGEKVEKATKLPPLCNYPGEGFKHMTEEEHKRHRWSDRRYTNVIKATETAGTHRIRVHNGQNFRMVPVYITDLPVKMPPKPSEPTKLPERIDTGGRYGPVRHGPAEDKPETTDREREFQGMRDTLDGGGVQAVSAPQLFPTPPELARELVTWADVRAGQRVLEPSAGTGALVRAIVSAFTGADCGRVQTVEVSLTLCKGLEDLRQGLLYAKEHNFGIRCADFLEVDPADYPNGFHRVVMNPPFENGADIRHIQHARKFLRPGGRLAAICAAGPRQREAFADATVWHDLPEGSFKVSGTNVRTAIVIYDRPEEPEREGVADAE